MEFFKNDSKNLCCKFTSQINRETTFMSEELGVYESEMELSMNEENTEGFIEWIVDSLDECICIGIWVENKILIDYDGVFSLPVQAVELLRKAGFEVTEDFL